ncbi:DUF4390 domain-containing protein [Pseudodesulfovibrio sp. JC047]|nr:DUF4390 domain-containing protein [Pseudodesulfovibrio sp. JC047]
MTDIAPQRIGIVFGAILIALILATNASAQSLSLMAPSLANVDGRLTARFGVTVEEKPVLKGELEDGAVLVLKCSVKLFEESTYWLDSEISSELFESQLEFDPLTQEFVMTLPGRETPLRNKNLGHLLDQGWSVIEAGLGSWALLDRGTKYSLRLHTSMTEKDAPEGFMRYVYFWSWDAGANNSFQLDFTY